jgi:aspartyl protease family protein
MSRNGFYISVIWLCVGAMIYFLADNIQNPNKISALGSDTEVILKRGLDGHYRAEAFINDQKVNVLVDTGATGVAISQSVADRLKLKSISAVRTTTANGDSVSYLVRLESVKLGGIEAKNVSASIAPGLQGDVLLGMSFLARMDVRLYKGEMTIKPVVD